MNQLSGKHALNAYQQVSVHGNTLDASPHELIAMLFDGALERIVSAKGAMINGDIGPKCTHIAKAIAIVDGLRAHLNHDVGGDIAANLDSLYEYMGRRLLEANLRNDAGALDEVSSLLGQIKQAWDAVPEQLNKEAALAQKS